VNWSDGYVVDVPYTEGVYREMTPPWLSLTSLLSTQPPLDTTQPSTYIELGCGRGLTAITVAATNPSAQVWACDFNPAHIERARQMATAAGLANCSFAEASFEDLAGDRSVGPPQADVIALHGVYSWITPANRRHVVETIRQRLVPGGLVYVSYSVPTGWAGMQPIQQALRLQVATDRRRSDVAIRSAVATIRQLAEDGARSFPLAPREQSMFDGLEASDPVYAAHEYLGGSFTPMMFADVAAELAAAKCVYVGSATTTDAVLDFRVPADLVELVRASSDVALRETICDLAGSAAFRRDVFRRGLALVSGPDHSRWMDELHLVSTGRQFDASHVVATGAGALQFDAAHYEPLVERLAEGPVTGAELRAMAVFRGRAHADLTTSVALLVAGGYAVPMLRDWERNGSAEATWRVNEVLIDRARRGDFGGVLLSPASGGAVSVAPLVALAIGEHWDDMALDKESLVDAVVARARSSQLPVSQDGPMDAAATRGIIAEQVDTALQALSGPLRTLGVRAVQRRPQPSGKRRRH
jgi:SAM-dependent methyltransferase